MNICVFLHLTHTERQRERESKRNGLEFCIHSERWMCIFGRRWPNWRWYTPKQINISTFWCVRAWARAEVRAQRKFVWYILSTWRKRAQHFHSLWCLFIILCANFSRFVFPFLSSSFDRIVCIPILLCCRHQHLIRIESKNGSVQMQTPLFTENRVEIFAPFCPQ